MNGQEAGALKGNGAALKMVAAAAIASLLTMITTTRFFVTRDDVEEMVRQERNTMQEALRLAAESNRQTAGDVRGVLEKVADMRVEMRGLSEKIDALNKKLEPRAR